MWPNPSALKGICVEGRKTDRGGGGVEGCRTGATDRWWGHNQLKKELNSRRGELTSAWYQGQGSVLTNVQTDLLRDLKR